MKIELAAEGVIVGSGDVATRISIVERIAHLDRAMDNRPAAVNYLKWATKLASDAGEERRLQDLQRQLQQLEQHEFDVKRRRRTYVLSRVFLKKVWFIQPRFGALHTSPNKQSQRTVTRRRRRGESASFHCAHAPRGWTQRAAAELRHRAAHYSLRANPTRTHANDRVLSAAKDAGESFAERGGRPSPCMQTLRRWVARLYAQAPSAGHGCSCSIWSCAARGPRLPRLKIVGRFRG